MVCNTARSTSFTWKGSHLMGDRVNTSQFISPRGALFVVATSTCQRMKREDTPEGQRTAEGASGCHSPPRPVKKMRLARAHVSGHPAQARCRAL